MARRRLTFPYWVLQDRKAVATHDLTEWSAFMADTKGCRVARALIANSEPWLSMDQARLEEQKATWKEYGWSKPYESPLKIRVSTVFLGIDHSFSDGPPLLFETMVFDGPLNGAMDRYTTWEQAEAGHMFVVKRVKEALAFGVNADAPEDATRQPAHGHSEKVKRP